jgi:O-antigen/teichoic acid export membrane protein
MLKLIKLKTYLFLKRTEKWTKTDMIYLAKSGCWLSAVQIISFPIAIISSVAFANLIPPETYGVYKYALSVAMIFAISNLGSMGTAITQAVSRGFEGSLYEAAKTKIKWGLLGGMGGLITAVYYYFKSDSRLALVFLIIALLVPFLNAFKLYGNFLLGRKEFKISQKFNILGSLANLAIMIPVIWLTHNIYAIIASYFLSNILISLLFMKTVYKAYPPNNKADPETIGYGKFLSSMNVIVKIADNIDKVLVWHYLGAVKVAVYNFSIAPAEQITGSFQGALTSLALPKLSEGRMPELKKSLPRKILITEILFLPVIIFYVLIAPFLFKTLYPQYMESVFFSQVYALSLLINPFALITNTFVAQMKKKELAFLRFSSPALRIILLAIFTPIWGIMGIIISKLVSMVVYIVLVTMLFKKSR